MNNSYKYSIFNGYISLIAVLEAVNLPSNVPITESVYVTFPKTGNIIKRIVDDELNDNYNVKTIIMEEAVIVRHVNLKKFKFHWNIARYVIKKNKDELNGLNICKKFMLLFFIIFIKYFMKCKSQAFVS